jgi:hypothetical protein
VSARAEVRAARAYRRRQEGAPAWRTPEPGPSRLRYRTSPKPYSNVFPDGKNLRVYNDEDRMMRLLHEHDEADAESFGRLYERFKAFDKAFLPFYGTPLPSAEAVRSAGVLEEW